MSIRTLITPAFISMMAWAQTAPANLTEAKPRSLDPPVKNEPFSAETHQVAIYPTPGGLGTPVYQTAKIFRDSQGRTRTEALVLRDVRGGFRLLITLTDSAGGRVCYLDTDSKISHCFSSIPIQTSQIASDHDPEDLGTKTVEGLHVTGRRYARTSVDPQQGPSSSRVVVTEVWNSPELQIELQKDRNDPLGLKSTTSTKELRRAEPAAGLFEVPADYQIVNESGDRAVLFESQRKPPSQPKLLKRVEPQYTKEAQGRKIEGSVSLNLVVDEDGVATEIQMVKPLDPDLDQEAIKAVRQWRFQPGQRNGKPFPVLAQVSFDFRLGKRK